MTTKPAVGTMIRSAADLHAMWQTMIGPGGFTRHSVWLVFLDERGQTLPVAAPIDDIPAEPDPRLTGGLRAVIEGVVQGGVAASVVVLLSRPGPPAMTVADRRWARELNRLLAPGLTRWPIHLATAGGVRVFAPDDLVVAC